MGSIHWGVNPMTTKLVLCCFYTIHIRIQFYNRQLLSRVYVLSATHGYTCAGLLCGSSTVPIIEQYNSHYYYTMSYHYTFTSVCIILFVMVYGLYSLMMSFEHCYGQRTKQYQAKLLPLNLFSGSKKSLHRFSLISVWFLDIVVPFLSMHELCYGR